MRRLTHVEAPGFILIETLVAWLVLSVGLLGLSALFARSVAHARTALYRTSAAYLTEDLAESIRANAAGGQAYDPRRYGAGPSSRDCDGVSSAVAACSPADLAEDDLMAWEMAIQSALPEGGQLSVEQTPAAGAADTSHFRITLQWREPDSVEPLVASSVLIVAPPKAAP